MEFSKSKAATKGLIMVVVVYVATEVQGMVQAGTFPMTKEAWQERGVALVLALIVGAIKVVENTMKHRGKPGNPIPPKSKSFPDVYRLLPFVLAAGLVLQGCATNSIRVEEITPDNAKLVVEQKTQSTWGSRTEEGQGSFSYTGKSPDGSNFDMQAGAGVIGQQSADPSAMVIGMADLIKTIFSAVMTARTAPPEPPQSGLEPIQALKLELRGGVTP